MALCSGVTLQNAVAGLVRGLGPVAFDHFQMCVSKDDAYTYLLTPLLLSPADD